MNGWSTYYRLWALGGAPCDGLRDHDLSISAHVRAKNRESADADHGGHLVTAVVGCQNSELLDNELDVTRNMHFVFGRQ